MQAVLTSGTISALARRWQLSVEAFVDFAAPSTLCGILGFAQIQAQWPGSRKAWPEKKENKQSHASNFQTAATKSLQTLHATSSKGRTSSENLKPRLIAHLGVAQATRSEPSDFAYTAVIAAQGQAECQGFRVFSVASDEAQGCACVS